MTLNVTFIILNNDTSWARSEVFFLIYLPSHRFQIVLSWILSAVWLECVPQQLVLQTSPSTTLNKHRQIEFFTEIAAQ